MADKHSTGTRSTSRLHTASAATPPAGSLVHPLLDPWLLGGIGIAAWVLFSLSDWGGPEVPPIVAGPIYWLLIAISGTHFGASYHLAYGLGRSSVRRHWFALAVVPGALIIGSLLIAVAAGLGADRIVDESVRFLLAAVYTLTAWHYVKQVYGVVLLSAKLRNLSVPRWAVRTLRYGLYPLWFLEVVRVWTGRRGSSFRDFEASYDLLPADLYGIVQVVTVLSVAVYVGTFAALVMRWKQLPATIYTPYAVSFLWFLAPPSYASVVVVFAALHGLQYLACAHRAEMVWGVERGATDLRWWWFSAFGGAFATGLLLVYWLPRVLTAGTDATAVGTVPAALLFVLFNLHHYAVDAVIWRSGGEHVQRIIAGPAVGPVPSNGLATATS